MWSPFHSPKLLLHTYGHTCTHTHTRPPRAGICSPWMCPGVLSRPRHGEVLLLIFCQGAKCHLDPLHGTTPPLSPLFLSTQCYSHVALTPLPPLRSPPHSNQRAAPPHCCYCRNSDRVKSVIQQCPILLRQRAHVHSNTQTQNLHILRHVWENM